MASTRTDSTRNKIFDAAISCYAEADASPTIEQILAIAGVGRTTFYRHFSNLEDVIGQAVVRDLESLMSRVESEVGYYPEVEDKIVEGMMFCLRELPRHPVIRLIYTDSTAMMFNRIGTYEDSFNQLGARNSELVYNLAKEQGKIREGVELSDFVEWCTRVLLSFLMTPSQYHNDTIRMRQTLKNFLVPALIVQ
ncbi:hypothetical protein SIN8267_01826 [Sinobacterium norvegicum]|uniref:HTH tetR-type domain-containing protein n=1 Tax=Sinobacterium norvegicum TaxID=1641715 RepID=A0ABM9AET4_9GAMM|nr:TetR/AcrR family transcriptional regulator [Sinobacterium norvegicum]CAH0991712.1 hypothetical protein SIN8267_01826 [Sinobacterium norvegicum]